MGWEGLEAVLRRHRVRPIPGCPGRFFFLGEGVGAAPEVILAGVEGVVGPVRARVKGARDEVWVWGFPCGGGVISYHRRDGSWLHTLNTPHGLARKLRQLGLSAPQA